jgi:serine/threonine protein kinase
VAALADLAEKGYTHRDIKPENILVFEENGVIHVKLTDLGYACHLNDKISLRGIFGSPAWCSPELLRKSREIPDNSELGTPADIWGIGLIINVLVRGSVLPFQECLFAIEKMARDGERLQRAIALLVQQTLDIQQDLELTTLLQEIQNNIENDPPLILREELLQLAFDSLPHFELFKQNRTQQKAKLYFLPAVRSDLIILLREELAAMLQLSRLAEKVWPKLSKTLPASPRTIAALEDLSKAMVQDTPDARITIARALKEVEAFRSDTPVSR